LIILSVSYLCTYSHATEDALALIETETQDEIVFGSSERALIFYPGGKVAPEAYAPLAKALSREGIMCIIVKMPFNLAVFSPDKADVIRDNHPEVRTWYIGGHSLGGSMASSNAAKNPDSYDALILLASYSVSDISDSGLKVLSLYGSNDGVLKLEKYASSRSNLPEDFREVVIEGGNHAQFGSYGKQNGDNDAMITPEEQMNIAVREILSFL
ncbi:MAG: alpha/beta hydrolase, partial [Bullifex sp.]